MKNIVSDTKNNTCGITMDADIMFNGKILEMIQPTSKIEINEIIAKSSK